MRDKISKLKSVIKKYGLIETIKKILQRLRSKLDVKLNVKLLLKTKKEREKYVKDLEKSIKKADRIIIWRSSFGWNVPLYQRPQHIANCLSKKKSVVLYEVTMQTDDVPSIKKQQENLYLVNFDNLVIKKYLDEFLCNTSKPKYIQIYSTNWSMTVDELKKYIEKGYKIIYEYIDDLSPVLAGTEELPINIKEKYSYVMTHIDDIYVVVTADKIMQDVISKRGNDNLTMACNGVDYNFFSKVEKEYKIDEDFQKILNEKKPIIGYYGAMASWFDYELIKKLARERQNYNIVLFGIKYDESMKEAKLDEYRNIHFMGSREYLVLKNYASKFAVCTIPFLINEITEATSPVKLFEYMALNKPIVTTAMKECKKYKSVMIAENHDEFIKQIDLAIKMNESKDEYEEYFECLKNEALQNDWSNKAQCIIDLISKGE